VNTAVNNRLLVTKAALWLLVGVASVIAAVRFTLGLGVTTALSDVTPWGMWIGFDVLSGVALAAGGFVIAATVHIFHLERYHGIVRAAILTAFLGYLAVILGLMVDLGRPWNMWSIFFNWNLHSPLFEVAVCVILYTTVLALEFAPVGLESFRWAQPVVRTLRKLTLPLVIAGICLSTLHQSSLGTLFLLSEGRMHPLWYSPVLPPLFLISAIALGLGMVSLEGLVSSWLYKREPEWPQIKGLTRAASIVLALYVVLRIGDLVWRGQIGWALDGSWYATLFWTEMAMSAIVPAVLFRLPERHGGLWAIRWGAFLTVAGFILHRVNVGGISHIAITGEVYIPALTELFISLGIVAGLGLIFLFFVENLNVWEEKPAKPDPLTRPAVDPISSQFVGSPWFGGGQRATLAWAVGAVLGLILVQAQVSGREQPRANPVRPPRNAVVEMIPRADGKLHDFRWIQQAAMPASLDAEVADPSIQKTLLIDSGGAGRFVMFAHAAHQKRLGGEASCGVCHHRNVPLDRGTSCVRCHQDMYRLTDTFDHAGHVTAHRIEKDPCVVCHADRAAAKDRAGSKSCDSCHKPVDPGLTKVKVEEGAYPIGVAPGYKQALHALCIDCHREHEAAQGFEEPVLSRCTACHRHQFEDEIRMRTKAGWPSPAETPLDDRVGLERSHGTERASASPANPETEVTRQ
jgi:Ni/Fe-hydrogenase subunit HybB-like protein